MALPADYTSGTITLTNGSPNFTGTGTGWQAADFREGDILLGIQDHAGQVYVVQEITSQTSGILTQDWAGASGTYEYRMRYEWDSSRVSAQTRTLIELLGNGNLQALANLTGPGVPVFNGPHAMEVRPVTDFINGVAYNVQVDTLADRDAYDGQSAGFAVLVSDMGDGRSALFSKASNASGDWTDPAYITGPVGPEPDLQAGTASRGPLGMSFTPVGAGYELDLTIPTQAAQGDYSGATAYITGDIVQQNGSSWVALQDTTGNAPPSLPTTSNTFWQLLARAGMDGAGTVTAVVAGDGIDIDSTDPTMPVVSGVLFGAGTQGDVPGPTAGDVSAGRVLAADGTWIDVSMDVWAMQPIGVPIPVWTHITGVEEPPTNQAYRYIKLTASDAYNTGVLTGENVTGSAPLVIATAVIDDATSPIDGETVSLINTERRALRAGSSGTVENDQMQQITGSVVNIWATAGNTDGALTQDTGGTQANNRASVASAPTSRISLDSAGSPGARTGNETRSKNIGVDYYMRIR